MKKKISSARGIVGRRVRYAGMEWTVRTDFGTHLEIQRGRGFKFRATVKRSETRFVRGDYRDREAEAALAKRKSSCC